MSYVLIIEYNNQNTSLQLIGIYDSLHECDIAKLHFLQDQLNCISINDALREIEGGYSFTIITPSEEDLKTISDIFDIYGGGDSIVLENSLDSREDNHIEALYKIIQPYLLN